MLYKCVECVSLEKDLYESVGSVKISQTFTGGSLEPFYDFPA